ncbi:MAG: M20/M25/M40 family metallo-hydrolase, partial [Deinococcales bacterium]
MDDALTQALAYAEKRTEDYTQDLLDFVAIPSVSTDPDHEQDIGAAAVWAAARLQRAGVPEVRAIDTPGHPVVVGRWQVDPSKPTIVIYGHYDVQPPDNLDLWETPPFEPEVREGKVFGRGASASKGSMLVPIQAVEAWASAAGAPPVNVTFVLEGEEVSLSPHLPTFLREHKEVLGGDLALSSDGAMFGADAPSLTVASRGNCGCEVVVQGAATDLHSGAYGGPVPNTLLALARILSSLHDMHGRVAVPGFYDGVHEPSEAVRAAIANIPFDGAV